MVATIREFQTSDDELIRGEVFGSGRPAVLRGLVRQWPAVNIKSPAALVEYLRRFDNGTPVDAVMTPPEIGGKIFYDEAMKGFNFVRNRLPLTTVADVEPLGTTKLAGLPMIVVSPLPLAMIAVDPVLKAM